jgi:hypothetical protein
MNVLKYYLYFQGLFQMNSYRTVSGIRVFLVGKAILN